MGSHGIRFPGTEYANRMRHKVIWVKKVNDETKTNSHLDSAVVDLAASFSSGPTTTRGYFSQFGQPAFGIDIDFRTSNKTGGSTGEAGGIFERFPEGAPKVGSYGTPLGRTFTLDDSLLFSTKVFDSGNTEPYLGFYNEVDFVSSVPANFPRAFLGYGPDINGDSFIKVYSPGGNSTIDASTDPTGQFEVYVAYDPDSGMTHATCRGADNACGQITYSITGLGHPEILDLSPAVRNSGVEFTHFGLNVLSDSHGSGFRSGTFYIDDVTYTSAAGESPTIQFKWNASGLAERQ